VLWDKPFSRKGLSEKELTLPNEMGLRTSIRPRFKLNAFFPERRPRAYPKKGSYIITGKTANHALSKDSQR